MLTAYYVHFHWKLVDQTPTPTRFLRNCEESGLFQELEEANPFEQDFKDATPTGSSKPPLAVTQSGVTNAREDSLHSWLSLTVDQHFNLV